MLPPRALIFPHQSLQWPHLTDLLNALLEPTTLDERANPLSLLLPVMRHAAQPMLCLVADTIEQAAAWADVAHAHHFTAHLILTPELLHARDLFGLGLAPIFHARNERALLDLDLRAQRRFLDAVHEATPARLTPILSLRPNAYGVALDDLLVEQCARAASARHFLLPELHPPLALLAIRSRELHITRAHQVTPDEEATFLRAWLDGAPLTTAHAAAKKITAKLFAELTRRRNG